MAKKQGKSNMIGEITVYSKKKQKDELLKLKSNMEKYVADMNKYKVDSAQWAKANKAYQDSTYAYNKGLSDIKAGKGYEPYEMHGQMQYEGGSAEAHAKIQSELGKRDYDYLTTGKADVPESERPYNPQENISLFKVPLDGDRTKVNQNGSDPDAYWDYHDRFKKSKTINGVAPTHIYEGAEVAPMPLYKQPVNKPTQPNRPEKDFPSDVKYDNTYEGLRMRPWWASAAMQDSTQNIGTLNPLDTGFKDGFNVQDAQSFPQEIKDQYNIDYIQDKMNNKQYANGGYIPSYGGYGNLPQYGLGSWMKENIGNIGSVGGKVMSGIGGALMTTGVGAPLGAALLGGGALASGLGDNYNNKMNQESQMDAAEEQRAFEISQYEDQQAMMQQQQDAASRSNLINSRMQGLQAQPQYTTNFAANGGFLQSYANGGMFGGRNKGQSTYDGNVLSPESAYAMFVPQRFNQRMLTPGVQRSIENKTNNDMESLNMGSSKNSIYYKDPNDKMAILSQRGGPGIPKGRKKDWMQFVGEFNKKAGEKNYLLDTPSDPSINTTRYDNGGFMEEVDKNPDLTYFKGPTHEKNPLGGIPIGDKGSVEGNEFKAMLKDGEYIFSNRF